MNKKERYLGIIEHLTKFRPSFKTELSYPDHFGLLVAVILSAQCTDKRVNIITPGLLRAFPDAASMSKAGYDEVFNLIRSCSYPNNKSRYLVDMSRILIEKYGGCVPSGFDQLRSLPGVGRKTANVMLAVAFDIPAMAVDTHVFRVTGRIGLTRGSKTPENTEKELTKHLPAELLNVAHNWFILHGRYVCIARKPRCEKCEIKGYCLFYSENEL